MNRAPHSKTLLFSVSIVITHAAPDYSAIGWFHHSVSVLKSIPEHLFSKSERFPYDRQPAHGADAVQQSMRVLGACSGPSKSKTCNMGRQFIQCFSWCERF